MSARLVYQDIAVGAAADASVAATGAAEKSDVSLLPEGAVHLNFASLELNKWGGGGSTKIYNTQDIAFISAEISGADSEFETPPVITITFGSNYTAAGVAFRFAKLTADYITSLTIAWYQGATLLDSQDFTPNGPSYFCENSVEAFNKLVITLRSTNLPYRYARVEQIMFGLVREFDGREIGNVEILQEVNLISAEISINTLSWRLQSLAAVDYIFQMKQPVSVYNDDNLIGVYYIDDQAKHTAPQAYEIPCCDAIGILDADPFAAIMYSGKNAVTALTEIVNGAFALDIDSSFSAVTLTGYIPDCTRREALQQVAFAVGAVVDTSGTDEIRIYPVPTTLSEIPVSRVYEKGSITQDAIVTAVTVTYHTYTAGSGVVGDEIITVDGTKYIHTSGEVTVTNPNVIASDKPNVKTVKNCTLVNASNAAAVANRVYNYYARRNRVESKIVLDGEKPGDRVVLPTIFGELTGNIERLRIKLSNTTAAEIEMLEEVALG